MLILSRRLNEKIVLPDLNVTIQVVSIKPGQVRLGIEAPPGVAIFREEILPQNKPAASTNPAVVNRLTKVLQEIEQ